LWHGEKYMFPQFVFEGFHLLPANATTQARELVRKNKGENTALYRHWNEIVSLYIAYSTTHLSLDENSTLDDIDSMDETS
jgi:hypothetical protein